MSCKSITSANIILLVFAHLPLEVATVMESSMGHDEEVKQQRRDQRKSAKNYCNQNSTDSLGNLIGDSDPFEHAYIQPVIRAASYARPKQPFSPDQLGREEVLFGSVMRERWVNW